MKEEEGGRKGRGEGGKMRIQERMEGGKERGRDEGRERER